MDERDYKAMNEQLQKEAIQNTEVLKFIPNILERNEELKSMLLLSLHMHYNMADCEVEEYKRNLEKIKEVLSKN